MEKSLKSIVHPIAGIFVVMVGVFLIHLIHYLIRYIDKLK
jgi:hypothetical protein